MTSNIASLDAANNVAILDEIIVFMPELSFFGGSTTLSAEDLGITDELPKDVVALGSKAIVDTDLLNGFKTTRKAIQRRAKLKGTQFLGGFAMSVAEAKDFIADVNPILDQLKVQVEDFLAKYPDHVKKWADAHPAWSAKIIAAAPSLQTVKSRFSIKMPFIKIAPPSAELGDNGVAQEVTGIAGQILTEIAAEVQATWKDRGYGAQQIKSLLRRISDKAKALAFINADLAKVGTLVDETIASFPISGKIEGSDYLKLKGLMEMLLNPHEMVKSIQEQHLAICIDATPLDENTSTGAEVNALDFSQATPGAIVVSETVANPSPSGDVVVPTASIPVVQATTWNW